MDAISDLQNVTEAQLWQQTVSTNLTLLFKFLQFGTGVPTHTADDGTLFLRSDGGAGTTLYVREVGAWVAK